MTNSESSLNQSNQSSTKHTSLVHKLMLGVALVVILGSTISSAVLLKNQRTVLTAVENESFLTGTKNISSQLAPAIKFKQVNAVLELFKERQIELGNKDRLLAAVAIDTNGKAIANYQADEQTPFDVQTYLRRLKSDGGSYSFVHEAEFTLIQTPLEFGPKNTVVGSITLAWDLRPLEARLQLDMLKSVGISLATVLSLLIIIYVLLIRLIATPLNTLSKTMMALAEGSSSQIVPNMHRKDEIGSMARAVEVFRINELERQRLQEQEEIEIKERELRELENLRISQEKLATEEKLRQEQIRHAEKDREFSHALQERADELLETVDAVAAGNLLCPITIKGDDAIGRIGERLDIVFRQFAESISSISTSATTLNEASSSLSSVSHSIAVNAEQNKTQTARVSKASDDISNGVNTVSAAVHEMNVTVSGIASNAKQATQVASEANDLTLNANRLVKNLVDSSSGIGGVIKVITSIAEQTNLLALNATIEAARAGDAGKGFAVVANEVKELAKETALATEQISERIEAIQSDSSSVSGSILAISDIMERINELQTTIATSVDEQASTTAEIAKIVTVTATGSEEITSSMIQVSDGIRDTLTGANRAKEASQEMESTANGLRDLVNKFHVTAPTS